MDKLDFKGPIVLAILDGIGLAPDSPGNAVAKAMTPFLSKTTKNYPCLAIEASGEAVGLSKNQMGNSEVGHRTIGSGQVIKQGIAKINAAFEQDKVFTSDTWKNLIKFLKPTPVEFDKNKDEWYNEKILHFSGIFSDGGIHSDISHLEKMIERAYDEGIRKIRLHCIFDGRDVAPDSALKYIDQIENFFRRFPAADFKIASGVGRMVGVSDRYESDWTIVKTGWDMMVEGKAGHTYHSATEAINDLRDKNPDIQDQYLPAFVLVDLENHPLGLVRPGDAFIFYDFRADRAIEISEAFTAEKFDHFDRGSLNPNNIYYAGLTEYDLDRHIPEHVLVPPQTIQNTLSQFLGQNHKTQLAISETVKFGHITYYFNGNSHETAPGENSVDIPSDTLPFNERPWMKAAEITDKILSSLSEYDFIRINYPNGDMVGHLADLYSTTIAIESLDLELARLAKAVDERGGCLIITADHGNAEALIDEEGNPKTSHTTNSVPFIIYDNTENRNKYSINHNIKGSLANIASTIALLNGINDYPESWAKPLIDLK